jgi:hypothetical protein
MDHAGRMTPVGALVLALLLSSPAQATGTNAGVCDVAHVETMSNLNAVLSRRAVEVMDRAATATTDDDADLTRWIAPTADFSLGAGDVGRPLGVGAAGARALARAMKADTFRFLGWDYIPSPAADPCGVHKVAVEFVDTRRRRVFPITFTFEAGRIVAADGWTRSFEAGPISAVQD